MSKSTHEIAIKAVDQTSPAFASIKSNAAATGASIKSVVGGALAAAGAYMGFKKLAAGVDELGKLSDIAQKASMSVEDLTAASTAFGVLGIQNMGIDQFAKSLDYLKKTTGRVGMEGFLNTIGEIGKIDDVAKRSQEAVRVLGRSGMEFMPLINAASKGTDALRGVIEAMPKVTQTAAEAGDKFADAKLIGADAFHRIWLKAVGAVCNLFHVDIRGAAAAMGAYMEYAASTSWRYMRAFFMNTEAGVSRSGLVWRAFYNSLLRNALIISATIVEYTKTIPERLTAGIAGGIVGFFGIFSKRLRDLHNEVMTDWLGEIQSGMYRKIERDLRAVGVTFSESLSADIRDAFKDVDTSDLDARLESMLKKLRMLEHNVSGAAISDGARAGLNLPSVSASESFSRNIRNDLIMAGSNASTKLQILGPSLQSEQKKTNEKLDRIIGKVDDVIGNQRRVANNTPYMLD